MTKKRKGRKTNDGKVQTEKILLKENDQEREK
jgi:hypothetical protein